jgi:hypothetical protein
MASSQLDQHVRDAVKFFWTTRSEQAQRQGSASGMKDQGARAAVTGGAQMDGFVRFVRDLLYEEACHWVQFIIEGGSRSRDGIDQKRNGICW